MADKTPPYIRGFIVPYALSADHFWTSESTITQNGSLAGVPINQGSSLVLTARGKQSKTIEIETKKAGHIQDGAGFVWKFEGDALQYGMEPPNKIMDVKQLKTQTLSSTYRPHDSINTTSGEILISYSHLDAGTAKLEVLQIAVDGSTTSRLIDSVDNAKLLGNERYSALCEMPDKSIILAAWAVDSVDEVANINIFRSTDIGITWTLVSSKGIKNDIDVSSTFGGGNPGNELQRIRIAATNHQVMLLASVNLHDTSKAHCSMVYQFASTNEGLFYKFIAKSDPAASANTFYLPDVVTYNDIFIINYISSIDTMDFIRFSNAYDSLFDVLGLTPSNTVSGLFATLTSNRLIDGDKSMHLDSSGRLYVYVTRVGGGYLHGLYSDLAGISSDDYAKTWYILNDKTGNLNNVGSVEPVLDTRTPGGVAMGGIESITSVSGQGNQYVFSNWKPAGVNAYAQGIFQLSFGGWSSQQYGKLKEFAEDYSWGHNIQDYIPVDLPAQGGVWTKNTGGTPTESLVGDKIRVSAVNADVIDYEIAPSNKTNGIVINTKVSNVSGSSVTRGVGFGCQIQQTSSTQTYYLEVVIGSNFVYVYDVHAGYVSPVGSLTGLSIVNGIGILVYLDNSNGKLEVFIGDSGNPRQYQNINGTLTLNASTTQKIYWGVPTSTGTPTTRQGDWHFFSYGLDSNNGLGIIRNQINNRQYSAKGFQTSLIDGLLLSTLDGPAREGESYTIAPQFNAPIERSLHVVSPSPEIGWRGDGVTNPDTTSPTAETIAWMMDTNVQGAADTHTINDALGIHLTGINFRSFLIQKYNTGVGWTTIATVDNSIGGSFNFSRRGASIANLSANGKYLHFNECEGWFVLLDDGAGTQVVRKISSNAEGVFANTTSKKAHLIISDIKNSDPTSGTAYLIPSKCTVILDADEFAGIRIQISSQRTNEGYFKIGTMVLGGFIVTSPQYGRGRTISFESNTLETETTNGTLYSQKQGKGGRIVRVSWTDGVDMSALFATNANPDYYKLENSSQPVAAVGSAPTSMMGIVRYCSGSKDAIVYLPSVQTNTGAPNVINRYNDHVLATLGPDVQIEHVIGEENLSNNEGEVFRVSTIILREVR